MQVLLLEMEVLLLRKYHNQIKGMSRGKDLGNGDCVDEAYLAV